MCSQVQECRKIFPLLERTPVLQPGHLSQAGHPLSLRCPRSLGNPSYGWQRDTGRYREGSQYCLFGVFP